VSLVATSFFDSAVYEFNPTSGALQATLVAPFTSSLLSGPAGLTVGPDGNLYISSQFNNAILQYNVTTNTLSTFISHDVLDPIATANGDSQFAPAGIAFGPDGNLYVSLNGGQSAASGGAVIRFNITSGSGGLTFPTGSTFATVATGLIQPTGLTFGTASGDTTSLYVCNAAVDNVVKVAGATSASPTASTFVSSSMNGGMNYPSAAAWGPDGLFYVVDLGATSFQGNVLQFSATGDFNKVVTPTGPGAMGNLQLQFPSGILFDGSGHFLTANLGSNQSPPLNGSIYQYNTDGSSAKTLVDSSQFPSGIAPSQVALIPSPATKLVISGLSPTTVTAGNTVTFTVTAEDSGGSTAPGYRGTVQLTSTDGQAMYSGGALPASYTFQPSDNGVHTFTITLATGGNQTVTVTDQGNSSLNATTAAVTVRAGSFSKYTVNVQGGSTFSAGTPFLVTVQAADQYGNAVTSYSGPSSVTATINPASTASNFPQSVSVNSNGLGFFLGNLQKVGSYTITAASGSFSGTSSAVTITPGTAAKLGFAAQPVGEPTGVTLPALTVQVQDSYGNVVTSDNADIVSLAVATGPGTFTAGSTTTATVHNGVATFNNLTLVKPGTYTLSEIVNGLYTGPSSNAFTIAPLQVVSGSFVGTPSGFSLAFNGPYLVNSTTPSLYGTGFGATATPQTVTLTGMATGSATVSGGNVTAITVTSSVLYTSPPTITITGGGGSGAHAIAVLKNGGTDPSGDSVISVTVTNQGFGYTSAPTVAFSGVPVAGTVVLSTATNSLTFVPTNTTNSISNLTPLLLDGQYVAVVHGTAAGNGFQSINSGGGFLDGTNSGSPGHDFTATFSVGASAAADDIVWTPATADGPLQKLSAPGNNQGNLNPVNPFTGYPVYINDITGNVTSVTGTFNYNPSMLTVTGGTTSGLLPGSTFTVTVTGPGTATFTYTDAAGGPNKGKLTGGSGSANAIVPGLATSAPALGFIMATVPNSSAATPIYKGKDLLSISGVQINGSGAIPVIGDMAVHLVAYVADGDGNGSYSSSDAVFVTRVLTSADLGFAAYPLVDPTIVADTDGAGFLPSDAPLQANEAGVGFPTANLANPPIPPGANVTPIGNNVDPALSVQRSADGTSVAVSIDDAHPEGSTGLTTAHVALTYDPSQLTISAADIHLGSVPASGSGWSLSAIVDQATGQIAITLSSSAPIAQPIGGSLVTIDLHPKGNSAPTPVRLVAFVKVNGQDFATYLADAQGSFTLTPALTSDFAALDQCFAQMAH
jgi:hypothetical protein